MVERRLIFASRIDGWLAALMPMASFVSGMVLALVTQQRGIGYGINAALPIGGPAVVLPVRLLLQTEYTLTDEELLVRSGPFRWRVPLCDVEAWTPCRSGWSSPALSVDRLRIDDGHGRSLLVSPKERARFASERSRSVALSRVATP